MTYFFGLDFQSYMLNIILSRSTAGHVVPSRPGSLYRGGGESAQHWPTLISISVWVLFKSFDSMSRDSSSSTLYAMRRIGRIQSFSTSPLLLANFSSSFQDFPIALNSCSVDLRQVAGSWSSSISLSLGVPF